MPSVTVPFTSLFIRFQASVRDIPVTSMSFTDTNSSPANICPHCSAFPPG